MQNGPAVKSNTISFFQQLVRLIRASITTLRFFRAIYLINELEISEYRQVAVSTLNENLTYIRYPIVYVRKDYAVRNMIAQSQDFFYLSIW